MYPRLSHYEAEDGLKLGILLAFTKLELQACAITAGFHCAGGLNRSWCLLDKQSTSYTLRPSDSI